MAFTAFYVILVQVRWELTFNRAIPDAGRIYLVAPLSPFDETGYSSQFAAARGGTAHRPLARNRGRRLHPPLALGAIRMGPPGR